MDSKVPTLGFDHVVVTIISKYIYERFFFLNMSIVLFF